MVASFIPEDIHIWLQSENGILGMGGLADGEERDFNIVNAGGQTVTVEKEACFFDSAFSFGIIRGGHVDVTVLGALQVDRAGSLASHIIPGKMVPGMGGAMDLVTGSRKVIVASTHTAKGGEPKILDKITLPATAVGRVHRIITELAVIDVVPEGLVLREVAKGVSVDEVIEKTGTALIIPEEVGEF